MKKTTLEKNNECHGLQDKWFIVESSLNAIVNVYDKTSHLMSLGTDMKYRKDSLKQISKINNKIILDAGAGTGLMAHSLFEINSNTCDLLIEFDALTSMLRFSKIRFKRKPNVQYVAGVFEYLPFKKNSIDLTMCGFSFRDAVNMKMATKEFYRTLKKKGYLIILDMGKPDFILLKIIFMIYWAIIPVMITALIDINYAKHYTKLLMTYIKYPTKNKMISMLKQFFNNVIHYFRAFGGVSIFISEK